MALFGAPIAHEDHAQRACYAALHLSEALRAYADELRRTHGLSLSTRMGLNSGEVVVGRIGDDLRMDYTAQGHTVGLAQRMEQLAAADSVYLSAHTRRRVEDYFKLRDLGEFNLKGAATPLRVYELLGTGAVRTRLDVSRARGLTRFVGRGDETSTLTAALARAREGHGQVVGVVGEAGVGKSRLCYEFVEHCRREGIAVYEAGCPAHGRNIPFIPILELFRNYFGVTAQDNPAQARQKIAGTLVLLDPVLQETLPVLFEFMGVPDPERPAPQLDSEARQRRLFALLRQLYRIQAERGVVSVVLIDDLHWIDPASDTFIAQLVEVTADNSRSVLLLNFRPEYSAPWMRRAHYHQLPLVPLGLEAIRQLLEGLLGHDISVVQLAARIMRWSGGNPFYTEEIVRELVEAGSLTGTPGAYRLQRDIDALPVPADVRSVLAARIDRLGEGEKHVLQAASVIGKKFSAPLLERVLGTINSQSPEASAPGEALHALIEAEFIYEEALYPVAEYAFKHPLTQEVALGSQLLEHRRRTHAAVADAWAALYAGALDEHAALLAHHYEQARDPAAAQWHERAAKWVGLKDIPAALYHCERVRDLVRDAAQADGDALMISACSQALMYAWRAGGSNAEWRTLFEEGCAAAERAGDLPGLVMLNSGFGAGVGFNHGNGPDFVHYTGEAVRIADRGDDRALRLASRTRLAVAHLYCGQLADAARVADEAIALAGGDPHCGAQFIGYSPLLGAGYVRARANFYRGDPVTSLQEFSLLRELASASGYPEQFSWISAVEVELMAALGRPTGISKLAQQAVQFAEPLGVGNQLTAAPAPCHVLECEGAWRSLLAAAQEALQTIQERGAMRIMQPHFMAFAATAELELGNPAAARAAAQNGVDCIRSFRSAWHPRSYAVLARAQLALNEPSADIAATLDEYAALLASTGFHLHEGELHELRAQLAKRESRKAEQVSALARAHDSYTRFGMTSQAARVTAAIEST